MNWVTLAFRSAVLSDIRHGVVISNRVADTNDKAIMEKPKLTDNHRSFSY
jgi:hypothetical protein